MTVIGIRFKRLRVFRKMSLTELADGIISVSTLSRFENGKADIHVEQLFALLNRLSISKTEFILEVDQGYRNDTSIETTIESAYEHDDVRTLSQSVYRNLSDYHKNGTERALYNAAIAANLLIDLTGKSLLSEQDVEAVCNHISGIDYWGIQELRYLANVVMLIPSKMLYSFALIVVSNLGEIKHSNVFALDDAWILLLNVAYTFLVRGEIQMAADLMRKLDNEILGSGMLEIQVRRHFMGLLLKQVQGGDQEDEIAKIITELKRWGNLDLAQDLHDTYQHVLIIEK